MAIVGNRWDDGRYLGCNTVEGEHDHNSHNPTNRAPPLQSGAVLQLLVTDLGARLVWFWSHSMNTKFTTTPSVTTGQAAAIARECGGQPHQSGNDRLAEAINEAAVDVDAASEYARRSIANRLAEPASVFVSRVHYYSRFDGCTKLYWRVTIDTDAASGLSGDCEVLNEAVAKAVREYQIRVGVDRQMRDIAAAEDAVDPSRALPLTSIGPSGIGGEYQTEVRP